MASAFAATLEMVREGQLEIRQEGVFQPIYLRRGARARRVAVCDGDLCLQAGEPQEAVGLLGATGEAR